MQMQMPRNPRARDAADVEPKIKSVGFQDLRQSPDHLGGHVEEFGRLLRGQLGERSNMPIGRDHEVACVVGVSIE